MDATRPTVLLTGATGYVGGRLLPRLEQSGVRLRCLTRRPEHLRGCTADDGDRAGRCAGPRLPYARDARNRYGVLPDSLDECRGSFEQHDRDAAANFVRAAQSAGVRRIIYLGGLGQDDEQLSPHLRSRHEVGEIFQSSGLLVIEFRAAIVIGSGSLSFELVRSLVERLPVMICPRWVGVQTQPIAIEDLLDYLLAALDSEISSSCVLEIGGPDQVSYGDIMREYARQRGLHRWLISVPVLTPRLSSLWLGLVTPVYARVGRELVESLRNPTIVQDQTAQQAFSVRPRGLRAAIARALVNEDQELAQTRWSDALSASRGLRNWAGVKFGSRIVDSRTQDVAAPPSEAFRPIRQIGGRRGWYFGNFLWTLRGWIDLLVGGVGIRRGRRDPEQLRVGDVLDWWRVQAYEPNRRLRLLAEMKVPGRAWLEFQVDGDRDHATIRQTAIFDPIGLAGLAYWYALYPLHAWMFRGMLRQIAKRAQAESQPPS